MIIASCLLMPTLLLAPPTAPVVEHVPYNIIGIWENGTVLAVSNLQFQFPMKVKDGLARRVDGLFGPYATAESFAELSKNGDDLRPTHVLPGGGLVATRRNGYRSYGSLIFSKGRSLGLVFDQQTRSYSLRQTTDHCDWALDVTAVSSKGEVCASNAVEMTGGMPAVVERGAWTCDGKVYTLDGVPTSINNFGLVGGVSDGKPCVWDKGKNRVLSSLKAYKNQVFVSDVGVIAYCVERKGGGLETHIVKDANDSVVLTTETWQPVNWVSMNGKGHMVGQGVDNCWMYWDGARVRNLTKELSFNEGWPPRFITDAEIIGGGNTLVRLSTPDAPDSEPTRKGAGQ
jgi:hypothetical protein